MAKRSKATKSEARSFNVCCYIGPTITGLVTARTIYPLSPDAAYASLGERAKDYLGLREMFVNISELAAARRALETKGAPLAKLYGKLEKTTVRKI